MRIDVVVDDDDGVVKCNITER